MQKRFPIEQTAYSNENEGRESPKVLIVYDDLAAGKNAVQVLNKVFQRCSEIPEPQPVVWKSELLEDPEWSSTALADAMKADIVVIATSGVLSGATQNWIERCCRSIHGRSAAIIALCGSRCSRIQSVERAVRAAKLDFFTSEGIGQREECSSEHQPGFSM
jgi:hypothetical protein